MITLQLPAVQAHLEVVLVGDRWFRCLCPLHLTVLPPPVCVCRVGFERRLAGWYCVMITHSLPAWRPCLTFLPLNCRTVGVLFKSVSWCFYLRGTSILPKCVRRFYSQSCGGICIMVFASVCFISKASVCFISTMILMFQGCLNWRFSTSCAVHHLCMQRNTESCFMSSTHL